MNATIAFFGALAAFGAGMAVQQPESVTPAQNWTLIGVIATTMGSLVALVWRLVHKLGSFSTALGKYAAAVQLVARESAETHREVRTQAENYDRKRDAAVRDVVTKIETIGDKVEDLPPRVADEIEKRNGRKAI